MLKYLHIPKDGQIDQKILLKDIDEAKLINQSNKKMIKNGVMSINLVGVLDEKTIRIPAFVDDEFVYEAIYVLKIELKSKQNIMAINERIHFIFPNPLIIVYHCNENWLISLAPKRVNKIERERSTIEEIFSTNLFRIDDVHQRFLDVINLDKVKGINLLVFYYNLVDIVYSERIIELLNEYPKQIMDARKTKELLKDVEKLNASKNKLDEEFKKESMMRDKMTLHVKIKEIEKDIQRIVNVLKEETQNG